MSTSEHVSSPENLAKRLGKKQTPIAFAVAEYIKSVLHLPNNPYIFGKIQATKQDVSQHVPPSIEIEGASPRTEASNDEHFKKVA